MLFRSDFDKIYLTDRNGKGCTVNDNKPKSIIFNIASVTTYSSYFEGIEITNGAYYLNINPANTNITLNKGQDKVANQIITVSESGNVESTNVSVNNNYDSKTKQKFIRGGNATLIKNSMESNSIIIDIEKDNIDGSIFTPNKIYNISNYEEYKQYDGYYSLISRKEVIKNKNGNFTISTSIKLRKVGNITSIGGAIATAAGSMVNGVYTYVYNGSTTTTDTTKKTTTTATPVNTSTVTTDGNPYSGTKNTIVSTIKSRNMILSSIRKHEDAGNATSVKYKSVATKNFITNNKVVYNSSLPSKVVIARSDNEDILKRKFN